MSNNSSVSLVREVLSFTALKIKSCRKRFCILFHSREICFGIFYGCLGKKREDVDGMCKKI